MTNKKKNPGVIALFIIAVFVFSSCEEKPIILTGPLTSIEEVKAYLNSYAKSEIGNSADNTLLLPVALAGGLGIMTDENSNWQQLISLIDGTGKYAELDLSLCKMETDGIFDMSGNINAGNKIIAMTLPDTAIVIKNSADKQSDNFHYYVNLELIKGKNIIRIDDNVFYNYHNLKSVSFPLAEHIGDEAFSFASALKTVNIPNANTIGKQAFRKTSIVTADFPEAAAIDDSAFMECEYLKELNLPKTQYIGSNAFSSCAALSSVNLPQAINIGSSAFNSCYNLEEITFPASAILGEAPFLNCRSLASFYLSDEGELSVIEDGKALTKNYDNGIELISYPTAKDEIKMYDITKIAASAFAYCSELKSVEFPDVIAIGENVFTGCDILESVSFSSLKKINHSAFEGLVNLIFANFPSVITIEENAFKNCEKLKGINIPLVQYIESEAFAADLETKHESSLNIFLGITAPNLGTNLFFGAERTINVHVPQGAAGYGKVPATYEGENTEQNWGNGIRGKGWDGHTGGYNVGAVNSNIKVNVMFIK